MIKCKNCQSSSNIVRHHTRYQKYGAKKDKIIFLCRECHDFLHKFVKGSDKDLEFVTNNYLIGKKWWK